jgi:hypothetical protein
VTRVLTPEHKAAMQAGRLRARESDDALSIARVRAFRAWIEAGSDVRHMPEVPTDHDYGIANRA